MISLKAGFDVPHNLKELSLCKPVEYLVYCPAGTVHCELSHIFPDSLLAVSSRIILTKRQFGRSRPSSCRYLALAPAPNTSPALLRHRDLCSLSESWPLPSSARALVGGLSGIHGGNIWAIYCPINTCFLQGFYIQLTTFSSFSTHLCLFARN
jgi:hypothetical protein